MKNKMKNKKGFISVSVIYSFFIVFLLVMLAMLASYANKSFLTLKIPNVPHDIIVNQKCKNKNLVDCISKQEEDKWSDECAKDTSKCPPEDEKLPTIDPKDPPTSTDSCTPKGLYTYSDDVYDSNLTSKIYVGDVENNYAYFGGYMWRIVRINNDNTIRLIYAGEADGYKLKDNTESYITVKDVFDDYINSGTCSNITNEKNRKRCEEWKGHDVQKTRYNYAFVIEASRNICNSFHETMTDAINRFTNGALDLESAFNINNNYSLIGAFNEPVATISRNSIANCVLANMDAKLYDGLAGGFFFWNIGYMGNHTHVTWEYDDIFDNQNDSEVKMWVDLWYEKWQQERDNKDVNNIATGEIFCGDKNLSNWNKKNGETDFSLTEKIDSFFKRAAKGTYTFSGLDRLGCKGSDCPNGLTYNGTGAQLACQETGGKSLLGERLNVLNDMLGNNVINLSNYSVGDLSLIYEVNKVDPINCSPSDNTVPVYKLQCSTKYMKALKRYVRDFSSCEWVKEDKSIPDITNCKLNLTPTLSYYKTNLVSVYSTEDNNVEQIAKPTSEIGNGALTYPIALLSADEAVIAGARFKSGTGTNSGLCPSYLTQDMIKTSSSGTPDLGDSKDFWTMTLAYTNIGVSNGARYYVVGVSSDGKTELKLKNDTGKDSGAYIRPVINVKNLDKDHYCANGDNPGTKDNPYILGEPCNEKQ